MARAWEELGINVIFAESPQARGRIERLWGTLSSTRERSFPTNLLFLKKRKDTLLLKWKFCR